MEVWIVYKTFPVYDLVNDDLDIMMYDPCEIVGVYDTEEKAAAAVEDLNALQRDAVENLDADPIEYGCGKWEVL